MRRRLLLGLGLSAAKAGYCNPSGAGSYNQYPFSSNTLPTSAMPGSTPNTGNFVINSGAYAVTGSTSYSSSQNYRSGVGAYTASASPYGACDMGGNVWQRNEVLIFSGSFRGVRGGSWLSNSGDLQSSSLDSGKTPSYEHDNIEFRVASVPEPSVAVLAILACGLLWVLRRRFK